MNEGKPSMDSLKVGELAEATGVSVRTLHHYEDLGLLSPRRNGSGHRLYDREQVARLHQVLALRSLGLELGEIRERLTHPLGSDPGQLVARQLEQIGERRRDLEALERRLEQLAEHLRHQREPLLQELVELVAAGRRAERHYSAEQLDALAARAEALGTEGMIAGQNAWRRIYDEAAKHRAAGLAADSPAMLALAREAQGLIEQFTGGDAGTRAALGRAWSDASTSMAEFGLDPEAAAFLAEAQAALASADANAGD